MLKHIIRIGPDWLRCPLLVLAFPLSFLGSIVVAACTRVGRQRLLEDRFWCMPAYLFIAAWDGYFVPGNNRTPSC